MSEEWKRLTTKPGGTIDKWRAEIDQIAGKAKFKPETYRAITGGRAIKDPIYRISSTARSDINRPGESYSLLNMQRKNLFKLPFEAIKRMAFELSPELNKTMWDFQRYCNPGYIIEGDSDRGENAAKEFVDYLSDIHGSFDNLLELSFGNLFRDGRTLKELVLSADARSPVDVYVADTNIIEFRRMERGSRGEVWVLGQQTRQGWEPLEDPTIFFLALDPTPECPQGKSMVNPAIYDAISLILVKQAIQRILETQGYSRQDYEIDTEKLLNLSMEGLEDLDITDRDKEEANIIDKAIRDVQNVLDNKEVDSDYVHPDITTVNYAPGSLSGNALSSVDEFVHRLQQGTTIGGKSIPLLTGDNESLAESQADRALETYVDGTIASIQKKESDQWSDILTLANRVRGIRGDIRLKFQKRRVRDVKQIAETEKIQIENILMKLDRGFIDLTEAQRQIDLLHDPLIV